MSRSHFPSCVATLLGIALSLLPAACSQHQPPLSSDQQALALQQQGIDRIKAASDHFRKTGNLSSTPADMDVAEKLLLDSYQAFDRQGDFAAAGKSLVWLGKTQDARVAAAQAKSYGWSGKKNPTEQDKQGIAEEHSRFASIVQNNKSAIEYYLQAEQKAIQAGDKTLQVQALTGLANMQRGLPDLGAAKKNIEQAVQLGAELADKTVQFDALQTAANIQIELGNFDAALELSNRALIAADAAADEKSLFYGYLKRADVYHGLAARLADQHKFDLSLQNCEYERKDNQEALKLAKNLGFTFFYDWLIPSNFLDLDILEELLRSKKKSESTQKTQ